MAASGCQKCKSDSVALSAHFGSWSNFPKCVTQCEGVSSYLLILLAIMRWLSYSGLYAKQIGLLTKLAATLYQTATPAVIT